MDTIPGTTVRTGRKRGDYSATQFGRWVDESGLTLQEIADRLGTVPSQVRRWAIGDHRPSEQKRAEIFEVSGGVVEPPSFDRAPDLPPTQDIAT